jgi:hypothetical protein
VTFETEPLAERVEILGASLVALGLTSPYRGLAVARLCDVWPDGRSTRVSFGVRRGTFQPGTLTLAMNDTAYAFVPGHRIRLALSTSYWPMVWPEPGREPLSLELGRSTLELPVRPTDPADDQLASLGDPWRPPVEADRGSEPAYRRVVQASEVENEIDSGEVRVRSTGTIFRTGARDVATIHDDDPLSARMESERWVELGFAAGESVSVNGTLALTANASSYRLHGTLAATQDGSPVATREFEHVIPRVMEE